MAVTVTGLKEDVAFNGSVGYVAAGGYIDIISNSGRHKMVRRIVSLFYAKIMVVGDGQFYRGFGGYWVVGFLGCDYSCSSQFGTDLALVE